MGTIIRVWIPYFGILKVKFGCETSQGLVKTIKLNSHVHCAENTRTVIHFVPVYIINGLIYIRIIFFSCVTHPVAVVRDELSFVKKNLTMLTHYYYELIEKTACRKYVIELGMCISPT